MTDDKKEHATLFDVLNKIIIVGGVVGVLWGGGAWIYSMTELVATKEYHNNDREETVQQLIDQIDEAIAPVKASAENTEASAVVSRIQNILDLKCKAEIPMAVENILQDQLDRYEELMDRKFNVGGCRDGKRITVYEMTNPPEVDQG